MIWDKKKHCQKIKYFNNMSNSMIFGGHFENIHVISQLANIVFWIQHTKLPLIRLSKIVSEYDQEIPQSQTADNPAAPRGRAAQPSQDTRKTKAKQSALSSPSR